MNQQDYIRFWTNVHTLVDDAMEKRDRSVAIYISPDNGMSVNVYPWPDADDLYEMYKDGKISLNDFREKCGLPTIEVKGEIAHSPLEDVERVQEAFADAMGVSIESDEDDGSDCPWGDKYLERAR